MATGDTIGGSIRILLEDTQGNRNIIIGALPQARVDYTNNDVSPDEKLYLNTRLSDMVGQPSGAQDRTARDARFESGEKLIVQHKSGDDSNRNINLDADAFDMEGVAIDMNRDNPFVKVLEQSENELAGTTAEDDDNYVDIFEFTVPDRQRYMLAGSFEAVAIEA